MHLYAENLDLTYSQLARGTRGRAAGRTSRYSTVALPLGLASQRRCQLYAPPATAASMPSHAPRFLDEATVRRLLPVAECIDSVEEALAGYSAGKAVMPVRLVSQLPLEEGKIGVLSTMPCYMGDYCACKTITVFPGNSGTDLSSHQGAVLLFSVADGRMLSIVDGHELTLIRTAAASALATRLLANPSPPGGCTLCMLGTGDQVLMHLAAIQAVRTVGKVTIWGRTRERAEQRAAEITALADAPAVEVFSSAQEAVADADIVCTLTPATEPILEGSWLKPGAHINAVGCCTPRERELDLEAVAGSRLYVDTRAACVKEPGDLVIPLQRGELTEDHVSLGCFSAP
jgi:ornithine cyclodeaminase/alanine dehydrogenase-like protein (mu-crystallin family)